MQRRWQWMFGGTLLAALVVALLMFSFRLGEWCAPQTGQWGGAQWGSKIWRQPTLLDCIRARRQ
jgi:hypothetical protein